MLWKSTSDSKCAKAQEVIVLYDHIQGMMAIHYVFKA